MSEHVISGLKAKRAELAGKVEHLAQELEQARRDLTYIDGALHVFGYGDDPAAIKSKRYRPTPRLFSRGELQRTVFDQLRRSPDGIETPELTDCIMRHKGWDTADSDLRSSVTHKVGNLLWRLRKRGQVAGEMDGAANVWTIAR
jgi:hypothetical protein